MSSLVPSSKKDLATLEFEGQRLPSVVVAAGAEVAEEFLTFFAGMVRNKNTRMAYLRAWKRFDEFCKAAGIASLLDVQPLHVAAYIESIGDEMAAMSVKQHRAAISKCFDFLVVRQVVKSNPAASVAGPRVRQHKGKTQTLTDEEFLHLIGTLQDTLIGSRDKAFLSVLAYAWPRVSAAVGLEVVDYFPKGKCWYINVSEKGWKEATLLLHHKAQDALDEWIAKSGLAEKPHTPLFPTFDRRRELTGRALDRREALAMVKRRAKAAGLHHEKICNHSFRATGITNYMGNGGRLDIAQGWANHSDPRTTGMYDHSLDKVVVGGS